MQCFTDIYNSWWRSDNPQGRNPSMEFENEDIGLLKDVTRGSSNGPGGCGRLWRWMTPTAEPTLVLIKGVFAVASLVSTIALVVYASRQFVEDEQYRVRAMLYGTGLGTSLTVLTGSLLPTGKAMALADWCSRWAYEGVQSLTQFYLNAGCPISGNGFWDTEKVPLPIKELALMTFTGVSISIAFLSFRTLIFPKPYQDPNPADKRILINEDEATQNPSISIFKQDPEPIEMFESGKNDTKQLISEQVVKAVAGMLLIGLQKGNILSATEWLCLGYYLTGHVAGVVLGKTYEFIKGKIKANCPIQRGMIDTTDKIGRICRIASYGLCFGWRNPAAFLALGGIGGASKIISLHKFELLEQNDENVTPFTWVSADNIAKGLFLGLGLSWYISGMMDTGLAAQDYANIITYLTTTAISYPLTRFLAERFDPRNNSRLFSSLRFYFVNHNQVLILPYMLIRSAQSIGDNVRHPLPITIAQDLIAWASLGLASGNNRALLGIRSSDKAPSEMSSLALLNAWFIMGSQGRIRG